jgi:hypothetical protein
MTLTLHIHKKKEPDAGEKPMNKELRQLELEELYHLSDQIEKDPDKVASLLFPDKPADRKSLTEKIGQWAINQTVVLESNEKGKTDVAIVFNKVGNRIWQRLPRYARYVRINIE